MNLLALAGLIVPIVHAHRLGLPADQAVVHILFALHGHDQMLVEELSDPHWVGNLLTDAPSLVGLDVYLDEVRVGLKAAHGFPAEPAVLPLASSEASVGLPDASDTSTVASEPPTPSISGEASGEAAPPWLLVLPNQLR